MGSLWPLVEEPENGPFAFVTLRPRGMLFPTEELREVNPALLVKRLRNDFNRAGVTAASGFAFFGLDGEFDDKRGDDGVWDYHFHGVVAGKKIDAIEKVLRDMRKYKNERVHPLEQGMKPSPRVHIQYGLYHLPSPLTYCLESWFPYRPTSLEPDGTRTRSKKKFRIPNPYLQRWLIWVNRWGIKDFILMSGLTIGAQGLRILPRN